MPDKTLTHPLPNAVTKKQSHEQAAVEPRRDTENASHRDFVRAFILRLTSDPGLADDLVQETFLKAHKSRAGFRDDASPTTWLCAIALNVTRDHFRANARQPTQVSDPSALLTLKYEEVLEDDILQEEMDSCVRRYVLRLPDRQRDVVGLHDIGGFTHREVSVALDISESNSRILLHRGRAALKCLLEENCDLSFEESVPCQPKADRY